MKNIILYILESLNGKKEVQLKHNSESGAMGVARHILTKQLDFTAFSETSVSNFWKKRDISIL